MAGSSGTGTTPRCQKSGHVAAVRGRDAIGRASTGTIYSLIGDRDALSFLNEPENHRTFLRD